MRILILALIRTLTHEIEHGNGANTHTDMNANANTNIVRHATPLQYKFVPTAVPGPLMDSHMGGGTLVARDAS